MQVQSSTFRRSAVAAVMACVLMLPVGCTNPPDASISAGASVNTQTGATTVSVTGTLTWKHSKLQQLAFWMAPLAGTDLASLDPSQAIFNYSLSNATISSTGGTVSISVTDNATGVIVGQQNFAYVVNGNGLFAQDPTAVSTWLNQFTAYTDLNVSVAATTDMQAIRAGTATATSNAVYQGITYASSTVSWAGQPVVGGGGCHTARCPLQ
jgi:hypothetical protein